MNTLILISLLLSKCAAFNMSEFNDPITLTLANSCFDSLLSADASLLYCSNKRQGTIQVYENSGHGFELLETLSIPGDALFLILVESEGQLLVTSYAEIFVFSAINGTHHYEMQIDTSSNITEINSLNEFVASSHVDQYIRFYQPPTYHLAKILDSGLIKINGFSETEDQSLLAAGNIHGLLRIFSFDGLSYSQVQEINVGFIVKFVHITQERLLATGSGGRICIYKRSGVEYTQTQSIQTHESVIVGLTDYQNYEGFVFGGNSNTFSVYELADASYELTHQEPIG